MLKDLLILFLTCLLITSVMNGMQAPAPSAASTSPTDTLTGGATATDTGEEATLLPAPPDAPQEVADTSDETFADDVLASPIPVLVGFFSTDSAASNSMTSVIESIAKDYEGKLKIVKLDGNINPETRAKYSVSEYPTFIIFSGGQPAARNSGSMSKSELTEILDKHVSQDKAEAPIIPNEDKGIE